MTRKILLALCVAPLVAALPGRSWANVPETLNDQGQLFDSTGAPATGMHTLVFTVYNASGFAMWSQTVSNYNFTGTNGYFSVNLDVSTGYNSPFTEYGTFAIGGESTLGVKVDADPEMSPRQTIAAVPFALDAANAESVNTGTGHTVVDSAGNVELQAGTGLYGSVGGTMTKLLQADGAWVGPPLFGQVLTYGFQNNTALTVPVYNTQAQAQNESLIPTYTVPAGDSNVYAWVSAVASCVVGPGTGMTVQVAYTNDGGTTWSHQGMAGNISNQGNTSAWMQASSEAVAGPLGAGLTYDFATAIWNNTGATGTGAMWTSGNCNTHTDVFFFQH
jgi:hypothetical protein